MGGNLIKIAQNTLHPSAISFAEWRKHLFQQNYLIVGNGRNVFLKKMFDMKIGDFYQQ